MNPGLVELAARHGVATEYWDQDGAHHLVDEGTVVAVETDGLMGRVELACGPYRVVSIITAEAVEELGLKPGDTATAVVKSTSVEVRR